MGSEATKSARQANSCADSLLAWLQFHQTLADFHPTAQTISSPADSATQVHSNQSMSGSMSGGRGLGVW